MNTWLAKARTNDVLLDFIQSVGVTADNSHLLLPRPVGFQKAERLVDVADRLSLVVNVDEANRVGVLGVQPERELIVARKTRRICARERVQVFSEFAGRAKAA